MSTNIDKKYYDGLINESKLAHGQSSNGSIRDEEGLGKSESVSEFRRQALIDDLIGMGFPVELCIRAANDTLVGADENTAIAWIVDQMELARLNGMRNQGLVIEKDEEENDEDDDDVDDVEEEEEEEEEEMEEGDDVNYVSGDYMDDVIVDQYEENENDVMEMQNFNSGDFDHKDADDEHMKIDMIFDNDEEKDTDEEESEEEDCENNNESDEDDDQSDGDQNEEDLNHGETKFSLNQSVQLPIEHNLYENTKDDSDFFGSWNILEATNASLIEGNESKLNEFQIRSESRFFHNINKEIDIASHEFKSYQAQNSSIWQNQKNIFLYTSLNLALLTHHFHISSPRTSQRSGNQGRSNEQAKSKMRKYYKNVTGIDFMESKYDTLLMNLNEQELWQMKIIISASLCVLYSQRCLLVLFEKSLTDEHLRLSLRTLLSEPFVLRRVAMLLKKLNLCQQNQMLHSIFNIFELPKETEGAKTGDGETPAFERDGFAHSNIQRFMNILIEDTLALCQSIRCFPDQEIESISNVASDLLYPFWNVMHNLLQITYVGKDVKSSLCEKRINMIIPELYRFEIFTAILQTFRVASYQNVFVACKIAGKFISQMHKLSENNSVCANNLQLCLDVLPLKRLIHSFGRLYYKEYKTKVLHSPYVQTLASFLLSIFDAIHPTCNDIYPVSMCCTPSQKDDIDEHKGIPMLEIERVSTTFITISWEHAEKQIEWIVQIAIVHDGERYSSFKSNPNVVRETHESRSIMTFLNLHADTSYAFRMVNEEESICGSSIQVDTDTESPFVFDTAFCGNNLKLSQGNLVVSNQINKKWNAVRTTTGFSSGTHYWQVHVEKCISKNIFVGVVKEKAALDNYIGSDIWGWGYLANKAIWHNKSKSRGYGELFRQGDVIGVTLDMNLGTLSFSRNGKDLGIAVEGLSDVGMLYPAFSLYNKGDRLRLEHTVIQPDLNLYGIGEAFSRKILSSYTHVLRALQTIVQNEGENQERLKYPNDLYTVWHNDCLVRRAIDGKKNSFVWINKRRNYCMERGLCPGDVIHTRVGEGIIIGRSMDGSQVLFHTHDNDSKVYALSFEECRHVTSSDTNWIKKSASRNSITEEYDDSQSLKHNPTSMYTCEMANQMGEFLYDLSTAHGSKLSDFDICKSDVKNVYDSGELEKKFPALRSLSEEDFLKRAFLHIFLNHLVARVIMLIEQHLVADKNQQEEDSIGTIICQGRAIIFTDTKMKLLGHLCDVTTTLHGATYEGEGEPSDLPVIMLLPESERKEESLDTSIDSTVISATKGDFSSGFYQAWMQLGDLNPSELRRQHQDTSSFSASTTLSTSSISSSSLSRVLEASLERSMYRTFKVLVPHHCIKAPQKEDPDSQYKNEYSIESALNIYLEDTISSGSMRAPNVMYRKFFQLIATELSKGIFGLLQEAHGDSSLLIPTVCLYPQETQAFSSTPCSHCSTCIEKSAMHRFIGRLIGIAIRSHVPFQLNFTDCIWKILVCDDIFTLRLTLHDLHQLDPTCADAIQTLQYSKDVSASSLMNECMSASPKNGFFKTCYEQENTTRSFQSTGDIQEYIICEFSTCVQQRLCSFIHELRSGIFEIIPQHFRKILTWKEFRALVQGHLAPSSTRKIRPSHNQ